MSKIFDTAAEALQSSDLGSRVMTTLDAAISLMGHPAKNVHGLDCFYGSPSRCTEGYCVGVVTPLLGGVDGLGRPIVAGLLADADALRAKHA